MAKPSARVIIDVNGEPRALLSFSSRPRGPLIIGMRSPPLFRNYGAAAANADTPSLKILSQKYTIHLSSDSKTDSNCFHHTLLIDGQEPINTFQYTRAIKQYNRFAPVFTRRFDALLGQQNEMGRVGGKHIKLGAFDPEHFTLYLQVLIGPKDRKFDPKGPIDSNWRQWFGDEFSVIILWKFYTLPAHSTGSISHNQSIPYELWENGPLHDALIAHVTGLNEDECFEQFTITSAFMLEEFNQTIRATYADDPNFLMIQEENMKRSGFVKKASKYSSEYEEIIRETFMRYGYFPKLPGTF